MAKASKPVSGRTRGKPRPRTARPPADLAAQLATGVSYASLAEKYQKREETISQWARSPEIQAQVEAIQSASRQEAVAQIKGSLGLAVQSVVAVLTKGKCDHCGRGSADVRDRLKASEILLDRGGMPATSRQEVSGGLTLDTSGQTDADLEREILTAALQIAESRSERPAVDALKRLLKGGKHAKPPRT